MFALQEEIRSVNKWQISMEIGKRERVRLSRLSCQRSACVCVCVCAHAANIIREYKILDANTHKSLHTLQPELNSLEVSREKMFSPAKQNQFGTECMMQLAN